MKSYIVFLCLILCPLYGLHNLLINGSSSPTLLSTDSLTITADFETPGAIADVNFYYDMNGNSQLDPSDPIVNSSRMIDGNFDDEDELQNGSYTSIDEPVPVTGRFFVRGEDNGVADTVTVTVNPVSSSYSISGTITEPANQEHVMVMMMYQDTITHWEYNYADFTDANGDYTISIPDNLGNITCNLAIMDWVDVAPMYLGPFDTISVSGHVNRDMAMYPALPDTCTISGNLTDEFGNPLGTARLMCFANNSSFQGVRPGLSDVSGYYHLYVPGDAVSCYYSLGTQILEQFYPDYMEPLEKDTTIVGQTPPYHITMDKKAYTTTNTISGHVYLDGLPYDKAYLITYSEDVGSMWAKSYSDGRYELPVSDSAAGLYEVFVHERSIPVGHYVVEGSQFVAAGATDVDFHIVAVGTDEDNTKILDTDIKIYPNPFKDITEIVFNIEPSAEYIELKIYDVTGHLVRNFSRLTPDALCTTHISWNGTDDSGKKLPTGVYLYRLELEEEVHQGKIIHLE